MSTLDARGRVPFVQPADKLKLERSVKTWVARLLGTAVFLAVFTPGAHAVGAAPQSTVTLLWDRNVEREVTGYRVYFGPNSRQYTNRRDVGNATSALFKDLASGVDHFFSVRAHDADGLESGDSTEVRYRWDQPGTDTGGDGSQLDVRRFFDGPTILTVQGSAGRTYTIEATQDWRTWTPLTTLTMGASGWMEFVDREAFRFPGRYYRRTEIDPNVPRQIHASARGPISLTFAGTPGQTYAIDATVDFVTWITLRTGTVGASGSVDFVDPAATRFSARFYRHRGADAITGVQLTAEDEFLITVTGPVGQTYAIETTEDDRTWTMLGQAMTGADGLANYADPEASRHVFRSYRAWRQL